VTEESSDDALDIVGLTANIVSAYVSHNPVPASEVPGLINVVDSAIRRLQAPVPVAAEPLAAPVSIKRSVTPDFLISLEDGKPYKTLKRHLTAYGLTPYTYRAKWGLPSDYPMVAPNYAKARSEFAKSIGLGRKIEAPAATTEPKRGRGRPKKAS
jgi:predicted transcriptional regulator